MTDTVDRAAAEATAMTVDGRYDAETRQRYRAEGWWLDRHLVDHLDRWADTVPDRIMVSDGYRQLTYGEFRREATALSVSLSGLGIGVGDRVAVQLPNWHEFALAYLAITRIGAVLVPIMPVYRDAEVGYVIDHSGAVAAVTTGEFRGFDHAAMFRRLRPACPGLRELIVARGAVDDGDHDLEGLVRAGAGGRIDHEPDPDLPHLIVYTSGTESKPKGCLHTWNTFGFSARGLAGDVLRLRADDTVFMPSPVAHSTGLVVGLAAPIVAGCGAHLLDVWEPTVALTRMRDFGCTVTASATPFVRMALDALRPGLDEPGAMRLWLCAGAPIPPTLVEEVADRIAGCRVLPLWGCSEVLAGTCCTLDDPPEAVTSSDGGPALPGVEIMLVDADGHEVAEGEEGELHYRGPGAMLGYWRDPVRSAVTIDDDGWYHSGDLGRRHGRYVRLTGRIKDLIIRGGTNISACEVEEHLETHPAVHGAAVVGFPDARLGERSCAFVVPVDAGAPPTLDDLTDYLRRERRIAMYKLPERLEIVDHLPLTATGKVQKFELRRRLGVG